MTPDTWNWNHAVRRSTTDADQQANCEVRVEEAGTELLRAFEVGIPQYGLQQEDTGSEQKNQVFCSISAKFSHCNNCEKHETRRHQFSN
jgi:hypothetical protein